MTKKETKQDRLGAVANIKVIDLSRILGGPFAGQILGDHGADVIKVEPPSGDDTREWGPPFLDGTASYFLGLNRNKRSISLNLRQKAAREVLLKLLEDADILIENFKTGTMEQWGLGYEDVLSKRFTKLIHCRVSGFGADGPLGGLPGYDAILQAMGGLMSVNGETDGEPTRVGLPIVDMVTGLNAVIAILLALHERETSGKGQFIEATLFDSSLSLLHPHAANYLLSGKTPGRSGNAHPNVSPYATYRTATGPIYLAVGNDKQFRKLCTLIKADHLAGDPRFCSNGDRVVNRESLRQELESIFADFDGPQLAEQLITNGVPAGAVLNVAESLAHPHTVYRNMISKIGNYQGLASPVHLSRSPPSYRLKPPAFGADTETILEEYGFSQEMTRTLVETGAVCLKRS